MLWTGIIFIRLSLSDVSSKSGVEDWGNLWSQMKRESLLRSGNGVSALVRFIPYYGHQSPIFHKKMS